MANKKSQEWIDGALYGIKVASIYGMTAEQIETEVNHIKSMEVEEVKTKQQIDTAAAASHAAQLRELNRIQKQVLEDDLKLIESHKAVSAIYHPGK